MCLFGCLQGVPRVPEFGEVANIRSWSRITIHIKTAASGVNNPAQDFQFNKLNASFR